MRIRAMQAQFGLDTSRLLSVFGRGPSTSSGGPVAQRREGEGRGHPPKFPLPARGERKGRAALQIG